MGEQLAPFPAVRAWMARVPAAVGRSHYEKVLAHCTSQGLFLQFICVLWLESGCPLGPFKNHLEKSEGRVQDFGVDEHV